MPVLLKQGYSLRLLDVSAARAAELFGNAMDFVELDLTTASEEVIASACNGCEAIVHLAGLVDYEASEKQLVAVNAVATRRLAEAAKKASIGRFVLLSSASIYGNCKDNPITEQSMPRPVSAYGKSKLLAEQFLRESGIPFIILRPTMVYGEEFLEGFSFVAKAIAKGKMKLIGDGNNGVSFVHVEDVVQAICLALAAARLNQEYIIVGGEQFTQKQAFEEVALALNVAPPSKHVSGFLANLFSSKSMREYVRALSENRVFSIEKAEVELGFSPKKQLRVELKKLASILLT